MESVSLDVEDGIATLTLNRPDSLNAMSGRMMQALERHLDVLADLPGLRVVVVTGSGRAFSAGGDLLEFEQALLAGRKTLLDTLAYNMAVVQRVEDLPVPVIAAVNGFAVAGGLELLLCCDIVVAAQGVKIGDGHAQYGVVPAAGATVRLCEKLPANRASQLFYTAGLVSAETLRDWGLVNEVVPAELLMKRAMELARDVCRCSPEAVRHIKQLTRRDGRPETRAERMREELAHFDMHLDGADLKKGLAAFRAKKPPNY